MSVTLFNIGVYLTVFVALFDQGVKFWILNNVLSEITFLRVNSFLNLQLSWNRGITFGLFSNYAQWMPYVLISVTLFVIVFLINWLRRAENLYVSLGLGFIMGGAIGNVLDRFRYGAVVDFLDFHIGGYHWYNFNVADSAIVLGVGLLLLENLLDNRHNI